MYTKHTWTLKQTDGWIDRITDGPLYILQVRGIKMIYAEYTYTDSYTEFMNSILPKHT